ncbi:bifunctional demethylmenaquinone methyltransferase/2-methoxy-6-polyprenyl-1,4-benzoquinol methylase UbiE [Bdellovibrio sp. 22V]|uniref:bifunctional demethylmenaquinone methyltransferase/2-methoxy-6-polyprenyl-1,4-benzoquinol methylase UbiE n=1 Tax=Bdellovibrio TaxID=958 RepID=UPI0025433F3E|nr:bifunctional demethylmenaquinone methyltransferase/2-methoxy-6-polyprenyl-1,4-benzoquinol methylase UbiE [Bdellovibrio sp. 22V]WII72477.1 bifunctional demethylmenaquinone methyltransferase/2-methoxy-6-polyprenyl-1,4-benzoquinol methylase UbiE [Bdellovibrio sp. 22V]
MQTKHSPNPEIIRSMFAKVAANYDKGNNVLSMGIHHLWRKKLVKYSGVKAGDKVLDCATGTGDLAIEFKKTVGASGAVTGTDFCAEMLIPAPGKAKEAGLDITFEQADVTQLQYADKSFDATSISFGIRNVSDPVKALREMGRVTKSGGKVMVLEFGQVNIPVFGALYNFYSQNILPKIGGLVTGQKDAYEYLQKSSAAFPCREEFVALMNESGAFSKSEYISLTGGIAYIYKGTVK